MITLKSDHTILVCLSVKDNVRIRLSVENIGRNINQNNVCYHERDSYKLSPGVSKKTNPSENCKQWWSVTSSKGNLCSFRALIKMDLRRDFGPHSLHGFHYLEILGTE
ncbi:hypothetical protein ScPMuIL_009936 [Solemya velum]